MPIANYGVWKAKPLSYTYETRYQDRCSPYMLLTFSDGKISNARAAININSGDCRDSRLVYWVVPALDHPIISQLQALEDGFHIRKNLFQKRTGRILPHDIPGENNDIINVLKPIIDEAISRKATGAMLTAKRCPRNSGP